MSLDPIIGRIERAVAKIDKSGGGDEGGVSPALAAYHEFFKAAVQPVIDAANKFPELKNIAEGTKTAFDYQAVVIEASTVAAKPDDAKLVTFIGPITKVITDTSNPDNRSPFFNHIKAFNEVAQTSTWFLQPSPKGFITGQLEAADFYFNKILNAAKDKPDPEKTNHRDYVRLLKALVTKLGDYADDFFKSGVTWKFGGIDLASFKPGQKPAPASGDAKATPESRLEAVAARLERLAAKEDKQSAGGKPRAVSAYEEFYEAHVTPFLATVAAFPALKPLSDWTKIAYDFQGKVITATTVCAKPTDEALLKFLHPIVKVIEDSGKTDNKSEFFNHQKAFNETIQALSWLLQPGPKAAIIGQLEAGDLYLNKILVLAKSKTGAEQTNHRDYVKNLKALLTALAEYANDNFKMGLTWKVGGQSLDSYKP